MKPVPVLRHTGLKLLLASMTAVFVATGLIVAFGAALSRARPSPHLPAGQTGLLPPGSPPPRAVFDVLRRDLGVMPSEARREIRFPVWNKGLGPLRMQVIPTCGCTHPAWPESIAPGESGEIVARFEPNIEWDGPTEKELAVHTNDPDRPVVNLVLAVDLRSPIRMVPPGELKIPFRPAVGGAGEIRMTPRSDRTLKRLVARTGTPGLQVAVAGPEAANPGGEWRLNVRILPRREPGDFEGLVTVRTGDPLFPEVPVWVTGEAQDGPVASPAEVSIASLTLARAREELARTIVSSRARPLRVLAVETGRPDLVATVEGPDDPAARGLGVIDGQALVSVRLGPGGKPGSFRGKLTIRTDDPALPVLAVPYDVRVD